MPIPTKALLVANPISGGRKAKRWHGRVAEALRGAGMDVDVLVTEEHGQAKAAAGEGSSERLLIAFGGDGTINEMLNGAELGRHTLAVVPAGTGNVLAKELGMSRRPLRAVEQLVGGAPAALDLGVCNGRRFMSVLGAGFDGWVVMHVHDQRGVGLSQLDYMPHVLRGALLAPRWRIDVEVDGRPFASGVQQVIVSNTRSYGGPIEMAPLACPDDGLFDVACMRYDDPAGMAELATCAFLRCVHLGRLVSYGRGRRVRVSAPAGRVPYEVDGDPGGFLPAEVELLPAAVRVLGPASFSPRRRPLPARP